MSAKKNALGRGLGALLSESKSDNDKQFMQKREERINVNDIPIAQIEVNPYQPRTDFDQEALKEKKDLEETLTADESVREPLEVAVENLPEWLMDGVDFVADRIGEVSAQQAEEAKRLWVEGSEIPSEV